MARSVSQRLLLAGSVAVVGSLILTGCGSSKIDGNTGAAPNASQSVNAEGTDAALVAMVPAALKTKGTVVIGSDTTYAPSEFKNAQGQIVGFDVELGTAIMKKLGLKAEFQSASFDSILGGIVAKKYDLGMSSFTDNKQREQQVDLVDYYNAGEAIATLTGNPDKLTGQAADLCGIKVSVQTATTESDEIKNVINPACKKAGKPVVPGDGNQFDAQTDATSALIAKRDQAMMADSPVIDYAVQQSNGQLIKIGQDYNTAPYGLAVPKGDGQFAQAIAGAIKDLIQDGTYNQILTKWAVQPGAITADKVVVNGATS
ncbi:ABC transporter substrate-binding protein [Streptacidiphilus jiangxiensis]|uniref:Polar amino acid transport system substrate-binding protein n=1 Tax=Streptacidiphilus jiangxiensis TaxID=235985 RepID=A0A1H7SP64_STRJI|nr:ABC transporter substrate-binding protein [Streptacidiphilus jiangxiensis]SEL73554.1 polar amino acid transport system substrate-binding protein [Streptacidiphilus jiangxiensis]